MKQFCVVEYDPYMAKTPGFFFRHNLEPEDIWYFDSLDLAVNKLLELQEAYPTAHFKLKTLIKSPEGKFLHFNMSSGSF